MKALRNSDDPFFAIPEHLYSGYVIGTCLSLTGLLGTIICFSVIYRQNSFNHMMILNPLIAIAVGQTLLLISKVTTVKGVSCVILAAATHLAWLSASTWLLICPLYLANRFAQDIGMN